ncbi:MAG: hypothetical protein DSM106950_11440 [Stigonema ocellatum SAG 48.90 = DSM 106950]|nr:hypothetical protein [Stigonema ocellatum SAG 48.90 = DSM 106950]
MKKPNLQPTDKSKNTQPGLISDINKSNSREIAFDDAGDRPSKTESGGTG